MTYIHDFRAIHATFSADDQRQFVNHLWTLFQQLEVIPAAEANGKIWRTRRPTGYPTTCVYFASNKRAPVGTKSSKEETDTDVTD